MNTKLITALRTAAKAIENDSFAYSWVRPARCNCGSLFCALTGKSAQQMDIMVPVIPASDNQDWTTRIGYHCPISGIPTNELFKELLSYGLTPPDMVDLEYLSNEEIKSRAMANKRKDQPKATGWRKLFPVKIPDELNYREADDVVAYMRAWADLLTERGALDSAGTTGERPQTAAASEVAA